mgnify:CR=1 FL=1
MKAPETIVLAPEQQVLWQELIQLEREINTALPGQNPAGIMGRILPRFKRTVPNGLYIWGQVGRGKTMLMDVFFEQSRITSKRRAHFHDFMGDIHTRFQKWRDSASTDQDMVPAVAREIARESRLLCFDEFQVTNIADAMILGRLFETLWDAGVCIVTTSNTAPDDLYKGGLQRARFLPFIETLKTRMRVLHMGGSLDYRTLAAPGSGSTYFYPTASRKHIESIIRADGERLSRRSTGLRTGSGKIELLHAGPRVAWADFNALCGQPFGAADYKKLAERFTTIAIDNVPRMNYDRINEALRFVTLIDILYERGTQLIVSAATRPESLFSSADPEKNTVWQRAVSRILEMTGERG